MNRFNHDDDDDHDGIFSGHDRENMKGMTSGGGAGCVVVMFFMILLIVSIGFSAFVSSQS